nr:RNA polymerase sigma factor [Saprospiraceae bacterium]
MVKLNTYDEEALVNSLVLREEKAFDELYDRFAPALYGSVLKITGDKNLASDILQESFVKIWQKIDTYDTSKGKLYTWMFQIVRNTALDKVRLKYNKVEIQTDDLAVFTEAAIEKSSHTLNEDQVGLQEVVNNLNKDQRIIIDLAYFGGFTQDEISKKLGIPLGTVKTRARSGLKALRKIFSY